MSLSLRTGCARLSIATDRPTTTVDCSSMTFSSNQWLFAHVFAFYHNWSAEYQNRTYSCGELVIFDRCSHGAVWSTTVRLREVALEDKWLIFCACLFVLLLLTAENSLLVIPAFIKTNFPCFQEICVGKFWSYSSEAYRHSGTHSPNGFMKNTWISADCGSVRVRACVYVCV